MRGSRASSRSARRLVRGVTAPDPVELTTPPPLPGATRKIDDGYRDLAGTPTRGDPQPFGRDAGLDVPGLRISERAPRGEAVSF